MEEKFDDFGVPEWPDKAWLTRAQSQKKESNISNPRNSTDEIVAKDRPETSTSNITCVEFSEGTQNNGNEVPNEETKLQLNEPPDIAQILGCDESKIEATSHNVTILNTACQKLLKEMEQHLLIRLKKNRKEQEMILNFLKTNNKPKTFTGPKKYNLKCIGIPYFKDSNGYAPPLNEDVLHKKKHNKLLPIYFTFSSQAWTRKDTSLLNQAVMESCKNPNDQIDPKTIDWMKISVKNLDGKYSPAECKSMWLMNLNPQINKSPWSANEMNDLQQIAEQHKQQNWDQVAKELATNRTGFQCCVQYQTHKQSSGEKWTKKEDETLIELVQKYKIKDHIPWKKVVWNFEGRTLRQCEERYIYHLQDIKKGTFTMEEDYILLYLYSKFKSFSQVAKYLPNRVPPQIRARYEYLVKMTMPKFSKEEDELLLKMIAKYPRNWEKISEHFQNRSKLQCRARWAQLQKETPITCQITKETYEREDQEGQQSGTTSTKNYLIDTNHLNQNINKKLTDSIRHDYGHKKRNANQYAQLLEHCKTGYKFLFGPKQRFRISQQEKEKYFHQVQIAMRNLLIYSQDALLHFDIESLSDNCEFDNEDNNLLNYMKTQADSGRLLMAVGTNRQVFPPNFITLIGLRSLLLGNDYIRRSVNYYKTSGEPSRSSADEQRNRILFGDAKKLFKARLKALFAFPLLLSDIPQNGIETLQPPAKKIKRVRPMSRLARKTLSQRVSSFRKKIKRKLDDSEEVVNEDQDLTTTMEVTKDIPPVETLNPVTSKRGKPCKKGRKLARETAKNPN